MVRVDGDLDPEGGEIVLCALEGLAETADPADHRTPAQRRTDALVEICRDVLDRGDLPAPSRRPHLLVTVPLETLEKRARHPVLTEGGGTLSPETLRRLACDAGVSRITTKGVSQPLDLGRKTRVISRAQWLAVVARDGRCRWAGLRPATPVVRRPSPAALDGRGKDQPRQPRAALSEASPHRPRGWDASRARGAGSSYVVGPVARSAASAALHPLVTHSLRPIPYRAEPATKTPSRAERASSTAATRSRWPSR